MKRSLILILLVSCSFGLFAQKNFGKTNWKEYAHEFEIGLGATNYLGELGGNDGAGARYSPKDVEVSQFKYGFSAAYRYNFGRYVSARGQFFYGRVSGSDKLTTHPERSYRNLAFHSDIYEFLVLAEGHLLRANYGRGYFRKGVVGSVGSRFAVSGHLGLGFFYFNPKYGNIALRPLGTEGQGLTGGPKQYSRIALAIPIGGYAGIMLFKDFRLGLDLTYRLTTTDYLDDASGFYFDKEKIRAANGDLAAEMSDRSDGSRPTVTTAGAVRGNPDSKDTYFTAMIVITYAPSIHGRHHIRKHRSKARF